MKITIVTPCYNHGEYLKQCIESVLNQTIPFHEYIILNDCSTDNSLEVMSSFKNKDKRINTIDLPKQKQVSYVLNHSIDIMTGDIWVWVPADDFLEPTCLEEKQKEHDGSVIYSCWNIVNDKGNKIGEYYPPFKTYQEFRETIWWKCEIGFTGIWIPKNIFDIVGKFPTEYPCSEDYAWMLKASKKDIDFKCIYKRLHNKRWHDNRMTFKNRYNIGDVVKQIRGDLA